MCGIVGYVGEQQSAPILVDGPEEARVPRLRLGRRGRGERRHAERRARHRQAEEPRGRASPPSRPSGTLGIGHTRWATHGRPSDENAHPHSYDGVAVVHNGIIENHLELKASSRRAGHVFACETDTEVFAHLIADELRGGTDLPGGGARAPVARCRAPTGSRWSGPKDPDRIVATKDARRWWSGCAEGQNFVACDVPALLEHTRDVIFLEEGDLAVLSRARVDVLRPRRASRSTAPTRRIDWTPVMAEKGGHKHFMHKEIHEQPRAVADTLRGRVLLSEGDVFFEGWTLAGPRTSASCRGSRSSPAAPPGTPGWSAGP